MKVQIISHIREYKHDPDPYEGKKQLNVQNIVQSVEDKIVKSVYCFSCVASCVADVVVERIFHTK